MSTSLSNSDTYSESEPFQTSGSSFEINEDDVLNISSDTDESNFKKNKRRKTGNRKDTSPVPVVINETASTSLEPRSQKKKIVDLFDIRSTDTVRDKIGTCKLCAKVGKIVLIKMRNCGISGLIRHVSAKHEKHYKTVFPNKRQEKSYPKQENRITDMFRSQETDKNRPVFDQHKFEELLVEYTVKKYLPFTFFQDEISTKLYSYLNSRASLPNANSIRSQVLNKFATMQNAVKQRLQLNNSRISFTIDGWTSISNKSFYGITAHFIDANWKIQSLVLDFIPAHGKYSGKEIAELFLNSVQIYDISNKIQGITTDNASCNFTYVNRLAELIPNFTNENHFVCFAHILNLGVQDFLKLLNVENEDIFDEETFISNHDERGNVDSPVTRVRLLALTIKRSEQLQEKFRLCCETANVKMLMPIVDVSTRWNSTFYMLSWSLKMKMPLNILCDNNESLKVFRISNEEWTLNSSVINFLRPFESLSTMLSGENYCTLPMVVIGINILLDKLETWAIERDCKEERSAVDEKLIFALQAARDKILKHYKKSNWIYCIALILDPRHKVDAFDLTAWGKEMKATAMAKFEELFKEKYYVCSNSNQEEKNMSSTNTTTTVDDDEYDLNMSFLFQNENMKYHYQETAWRKEIDEYYATKRAEENDNILNWWWRHEKAYPNLSAMARDFFSVMVATSVPAERLFSKASLVIRKHRNRLNNESIRSLMCLNSWLNNDISF